MLGPIVGGALVDADLFGTGWRLIFLVNLPLGIAAVVGAIALLPESRRPASAASTASARCSSRPPSGCWSTR